MAHRILWIDADTILMDMPFQMPFHLYKNKSFIAWGYEDYLLAGNQRHGDDTAPLTIKLFGVQHQQSIAVDALIRID